MDYQSPKSRNFVKTFSSALISNHVPGGLPTDWEEAKGLLDQLDKEINDYAKENNLRIEGLDVHTSVIDRKSSLVIRYILSVRFVDYDDWMMDNIATNVAVQNLLSGKADGRETS